MDNRDYISVFGAREHNLKNIDLKIPKNKIVVFTGLSGSGKSSLAFDTLYVEGQRRYVESLSSYARQFLGGLRKSEVERIEGLSPAISIDQKTTSHNPRSTVGTITEIYDYLRLLFAKIGHQHCPDCGREISTQSIDQIIAQIIDLVHQDLSNKTISRCLILSPVVKDKKGEFTSLFKSLLKQGFLRVRIDGEIYSLKDLPALFKNNRHTIEVVIDRLTISQKQLKDEKELKNFKSRLSQSLELGLKLSDGFILLGVIKDNSFQFPESPKEVIDHLFSEKLACSHCNISFDELSPKFFSFNSPEGACPHCHGLGSLLKIDVDKIIAPNLTLSEGAIIPLARNMGHDTWWVRLIKAVVFDLGYNFNKTPFKKMDEESQEILLYGSKKVYTVAGENRFGESTRIETEFVGFVPELEKRYASTESKFVRREIGKFMHEEICSVCHGDRLKKEALAVTINDKNIAYLNQLTIEKALQFFKDLKVEKSLSKKEKIISQSIVKEVENRLQFLLSVGLDYLTLSRKANTLAGGEAQRIRLASQIGTGLTGVLYILDEPTIGLHQRDNHRLIKTLKDLRDQGNSVIVVEHDKDVILESDYVFDFGPKAGKDGGLVVAQGTPKQLIENKKSLTGQYLAGKKKVKVRSRKNKEREIVSLDYEPKNNLSESKLQMTGAQFHNLQNIDVDIPLSKLVCVTGVSGSGKSTLLYNIIYSNLNNNFGLKTEDKIDFGKVKKITIPDKLKKAILINQSPIGKTPRSNPATYTGIFTDIRKIMTQTFEAKSRGFSMSRFSFNVKGGRCETCRGEGQIKIEMQFLPDVYMPCDVCHGTRYNEETLQVLYHGKNIAQILDMTVDEALEFFQHNSLLKQKLSIMQQVGLGYIALGQSATTLSGGEAQRVKLAKELVNKRRDHTIYLLDEPTTGLHFEDVNKLLQVLHSLVEHDNTVVLIEHNLDIIKNADWIIDLGPEGGERGGQVVGVGTPQEIADNDQSLTGQFLKKEL